MPGLRDHTQSLSNDPSGPRGPIPGAHLVVAFSGERPLAAPLCSPLAEIDLLTIGRAQDADVAHTREGGHRKRELRVPDPAMSALHARLERTPDGWRLDDAGSKNGVLIVGHRVRGAPLADGDLFELGTTLFLFRDLPSESIDCHPARNPSRVASPALSTLSPPLARRFDRIPELARSSVPVLIRGESGTGKEVVARAIHDLSARTGHFIAVNCGALPDTLVESELFGFRRGAFSGADRDRSGLVRSADRGTLFLDEIGDLQATSQAALLRVLQEREVVPLGEARPIKVDFRLVAATHRNLETLVETGGFRADLLARLSGFTFDLPPLRERREDLGLLIAALLLRITPERAGEIRFSRRAARALFLHEWPLNVRELQQCLSAATVLAGEAPIDLQHLPRPVRAAAHAGAGSARVDTVAPAAADGSNLRREEIVGLLRLHEGNVSSVARAMGKARSQVQRWIKRHRIDLATFRE